MIIVSKFDAWRHLLGADLPEFHVTPKRRAEGGTVVSGLRISAVEEISGRIKDLMRDLAPEVLSATEQFSRHVYFVPSSATGCAPRMVGRDEKSGKPTYKFRVGDLAPQWAEVPLLWMMSRHVSGLVPTETVQPQRA
jgi:hypothetical protein